MSQDAWEKLFEVIENSNKVMGVSDRYVKETKRFAQKLKELIFSSTDSRIGPFSIEEFEREYSKAVYRSIDRFLRQTPEKNIKRTLINISQYYRNSSPDYHAVFPIVEEPIHTRDMYHNGYYTVQLKVLLPDGNAIPLGN